MTPWYQTFSSLELAHVLPCRVPRTRLARDLLAALERRFSRELLPAIRDSARVPECYALGTTILEHDPTGRPAVDYRQATAQLRKRGKRRKAKA